LDYVENKVLKYYGDYKCTQCGHDFGKAPWLDEEIRCPRCGSEQVETNPYLLGTGSAEELTPEDYFAVALKP
jgi:hypothetical protein